MRTGADIIAWLINLRVFTSGHAMPLGYNRKEMDDIKSMQCRKEKAKRFGKHATGPKLTGRIVRRILSVRHTVAWCFA